jgi:hypothetical protein
LTQLFQNAEEIFDHVVVPEPDHSDSPASKKSGSCRIISNARGMLPAVQFDRELQGGTVKIQDIRANRMLPPERCTFKSRTF